MSPFISLWLLPSLIVFLIGLHISRLEGDLIEGFSADAWISLLILSVVYPFGFFFIAAFYLPIFRKYLCRAWQFLIKERGLKEQSNE